MTEPYMSLPSDNEPFITDKKHRFSFRTKFFLAVAATVTAAGLAVGLHEPSDTNHTTPPTPVNPPSSQDNLVARQVIDAVKSNINAFDPEWDASTLKQLGSGDPLKILNAFTVASKNDPAKQETLYAICAAYLPGPSDTSTIHCVTSTDKRLNPQKSDINNNIIYVGP